MYTDKALNCRDCGQSLVFSAGEQEFFASKGFTKSQRGVPTAGRSGRAIRPVTQAVAIRAAVIRVATIRQERQMFSAICSQCGKEARVPFQPREDRPVYCSDCFALQRGESSGGGYRNRW